jgi:hypothetical protein
MRLGLAQRRRVDVIRAVDHQIATGVYPDIDRARLGARRVAADLRAGHGRRHLVLLTPIWNILYSL